MMSAKNKGSDCDEALVTTWIDRLLPKSNSCSSVPLVRKLFVLALLFSAFLAYNAAGGTRQLGEVVRGKKQHQQQLLINPCVIEMSHRFATAKQKLLERLATDYGEENFRNMFFTKNDNGTLISKGRLAFVGDDRGWDGIQRKFVIKLLQAVLQQHQHMTMNTTIAGKTTSNSNNSSIKVPFVWATGGNSVAAGHGNLMSESYTAVVERLAGPLWESVGLNFVGRNYGMSAGVSAPEVALCQREMFGNDVDVLLWDYAITDGGAFQNLELFLHRAALIPSRPATIVLPRDGNPKSNRVEIAKSLEQNGMTSLHLKDNIIREAFKQVPDSFGKTIEDIDAMPEYVRSFKCDGRLEVGDPYCASRKFSSWTCNGRKYMTSWHPGWKMNAVYGTFMALFLVEVMEDALQELLNLDTASAAKHLLAELTAQEMADYQRVRDSELPLYSNLYHKNRVPEVADELRNLYYKGQSICHTAQLPAQIRYKGILTETSEPTTSILDPTNNAITRNTGEASQLMPIADQMRLGQEWQSRQTIENCSDPLNFDYRDFFKVWSKDGWRHLTIPNDAELREYRTGGEPLKGIILLCTVGVHRQMEESDLHFPVSGANIGNSTNYGVEMQVNGDKVDSLLSLGGQGLVGDTCYVLRKNPNSDGHVWKPNERGRFQISARVHPGKFIRFSSFIVY